MHINDLPSNNSLAGLTPLNLNIVNSSKKIHPHKLHLDVELAQR